MLDGSLYIVFRPRTISTTPNTQKQKLEEHARERNTIGTQTQTRRTKPSQRTFSKMKNERQSAIHHTIAGGSEGASVARRTSVTRGRRRGTPMYLGCQPTYQFEALQRKSTIHTHTMACVCGNFPFQNFKMVCWLTSKIRLPGSKPWLARKAARA